MRERRTTKGPETKFSQDSFIFVEKWFDLLWWIPNAVWKWVYQAQNEHIIWLPAKECKTHWESHSRSIFKSQWNKMSVSLKGQISEQCQHDFHFYFHLCLSSLLNSFCSGPEQVLVDPSWLYCKQSHWWRGIEYQQINPLSDTQIKSKEVYFKDLYVINFEELQGTWKM